MCLSNEFQGSDEQRIVTSRQITRCQRVRLDTDNNETAGGEEDWASVNYSINNPEQDTFFLAFVPDLL